MRQPKITHMKNKRISITLALGLSIHMVIGLVLNLNAQSPMYPLVKKTVVGGEGGWDYLSVDAENRRLYVSHSTQVEVLNADTHEKVGTIPNLQGVHGVIAVPKKGRGITSNGR